MAPKPQPPALNRLHGAKRYRKWRASDDEPPVNDGQGVGRAPGGLRPAQRREYRAIVAQGPHLTAADRETVAALARARVRYREACAAVDREGMVVRGRGGSVQRSPWLAIVQQESRAISRLSEELKLTAASRQPMAVLTKGTDKLEEFLREGRRIESSFHERLTAAPRDTKAPARIWPKGYRPVPGMPDMAVPDTGEDDG